MKKILSIILGTFICLHAFAQVSVNAGYLNSNYHYGENGYSLNVRGNGFYAGVSTDIELTNYNQLTFSPGANFNIVNYNIGDGISNIEYYIVAPLHVKYTHPLDNGMDLFISAGPSLVCSLGGKTTVYYDGLSYTENDETAGTLDLTLGLEGGITITRNIKLMAGYDFGLLNQSGEKDYRITRNFIHVGIGYIF